MHNSTDHRCWHTKYRKKGTEQGALTSPIQFAHFTLAHMKWNWRKKEEMSIRKWFTAKHLRQCGFIYQRPYDPSFSLSVRVVVCLCLCLWVHERLASTENCDSFFQLIFKSQVGARCRHFSISLHTTTPSMTLTFSAIVNISFLSLVSSVPCALSGMSVCVCESHCLNRVAKIKIQSLTFRRLWNVLISECIIYK